MDTNLLLKLAEMQDVLSILRKKCPEEGKDELYYQLNFLERIIDRIYPEKEAKKMKLKLNFSKDFPKDFMLKKEIAYKEKIKRAKYLIKLIIEK